MLIHQGTIGLRQVSGPLDSTVYPFEFSGSSNPLGVTGQVTSALHGVTAHL